MIHCSMTLQEEINYQIHFHAQEQEQSETKIWQMNLKFKLDLSYSVTFNILKLEASPYWLLKMVEP